MVLLIRKITCFNLITSESFYSAGVALIFHSMNVRHPELTTLQKSMKLFFTPNWRYTESGMRIGPNSSNPEDSQRVRNSF